MEVPDEVLVQRIAHGDQEAFAALYDRYAPRILGLLRRLLPDGALAEDALQDTFWQVWTQAARFDPTRAGVAGWLVLLARSRSADVARRQRRHTIRAGGTLVEEPPAAAHADAAETAEQTSELRGALALLPSEQRAAISLAFFSGLTHEQIATREQLALGTVKTRIRLGMQKLRDILIQQRRALA